MIKFRLLSLKTKLYADNPKEVTIMKEGIHPKYEPTEVRCACGEVIKTSSTKQDLRVDICSKCHPFFTGKQKLVDTGGRRNRFKKCFNMTEDKRYSSYERYELPFRRLIFLSQKCVMCCTIQALLTIYFSKRLVIIARRRYNVCNHFVIFLRGRSNVGKEKGQYCQS